jgi:hypothetical protein
MLALLPSLTLLAQSAERAAAPPNPAAQAAVDGERSTLAAERARLAAAGPPEPVRGELARRVALEQAGRRSLASVFRLPAAEQPEARRAAWAELTRIDQDNTAWLKRNLPADGWFRISRDGVQATQQAFLIMQHSGDTA